MIIIRCGICGSLIKTIDDGYSLNIEEEGYDGCEEEPNFYDNR